MSRQTTEWPQMPAAYAFPRSSKPSRPAAKPRRGCLWRKHTILREFVYGGPSLSKKNKLGKQSARFWAAPAQAFRSLRRIWHPNGVKRAAAL